MRPLEHYQDRLSPEWIDAIREEQTRVPTHRSISFRGEDQTCHEPPEIYEHSSELALLVDLLKQTRNELGLSLADIARVTQQARSAISRLENSRYPNPTLHTLFRYAKALGLHIKLSAEPWTEDLKAEDRAPGTER